MKPVIIRSFTHVGAIGVGIVFAAWLGGFVAERSSAKQATSGEGAAAQSSAAPPRGGKPVTLPTGSRSRSDLPRLSSREYKLAWDAIGRRDVTHQERFQLQQQVLSQWAEVDLEASLKAALASPWDDTYRIESLLQAFREQFAKNPIEAWDLLQSGKLGLGGSLAKEVWAAANVKDHPGLVLSYFDQIPDKNKASLLSTMMQSAGQDPAKRDELVNKLCEMPENERFRDWVKQLAPMLMAGQTSEELKAKFTAAESPQKASLYLHQFALSMKNSDIASIRGEIESMPAEMQGRAARAITLHSDATKNTPELFDLLVKAGEWQFMNTERWRLRQYANTGKQEELAKWALTLPENPGSQELFHRAVEPYINKDIDKAGDWIESLPKGWQRDRAMAELSQRALYGKKNTELSSWALNEIGDPKLKEQATSWRGEWAKRNGGAK